MKTDPPMPTSPRGGDHRGQTLIFLMMIMVILAFVMFSVYDTQHVIVQRVRGQNAVDAAALTGARWQLSALNAIGEINLLKLTTKIVTELPPGIPAPNDPNEKNPLWSSIYAALDQLQARIYFTGPLLGVLYAQQAAKLNGMHAVPGFESPFYSAINDVVNNYDVYQPMMGYDYRNDFINLVGQVAAEGVAAYPYNATGDDGNVDISGGGPYVSFLLDLGFYSAIAGKDYCYFYRGTARQLLTDYGQTSPPSRGNPNPCWGIIYPGTSPNPFRFLSLHLTVTNWTAGSVVSSGVLAAVQRGFEERNLDFAQAPNGDLNPNWQRFTTTNYPQFQRSDLSDSYVQLRLMTYDTAYWEWNRRQSDQSYVTGGVINGDYQPPLMRNDLKDAFKYKGADSSWYVQGMANISMAVIRPDLYGWTARGQQAGLGQAFRDLESIKQQTSTTTSDTDTRTSGVWSSAGAKPFIRADSTTTPHEYQIVLPVFTDVRLLPLMLTTVGATPPGFISHIQGHLPALVDPPPNYAGRYTDWGTYTPGCSYCKQLREWDYGTFRADCLAYFQRPNPCPPGGGGGRRGGGGPGH